MRTRSFETILRCLYCSVATLLFITYGINSRAQVFQFASSEQSDYAVASSLAGKTVPFVLFNSVSCANYSSMTSSSWWTSDKIKSMRAFVKFYVDHANDTLVDTAYSYQLLFQFKGISNPLNASSKTSFPVDTLMISYNPDSLTAFQDIQLKTYGNIFKIDSFKVIGMRDVTNPANPIAINLSSGNFNRNFRIELSFLSQQYAKSNYTATVSPSHTYNSTNGTLTVSWSAPANPASYQLEWTFVDNYGPDSVGTAINSSNLHYDFTNNSTRVWVTGTSYTIPAVYERGYIVYRVRMIRPDSVSFRYPIYSAWSKATSGTVASAGSGAQLLSAHCSDDLNWQYTVSFAEGGKFKHVLSYYDGLLKNRQSITRFNTNTGRLIVTENIYDYEGRPSLKLLPAPVNTATFSYLHGVSTNASTGDPYVAADFDTLRLATCPTETLLSPLSSSAKANIYYSGNNPDTTGVEKFVPSAGGWPMAQTIYSPGFNDRVEKQGGPGQNMQIHYGHVIENEYMNADQTDLNQMMGLDAGWGDFYRKVMTKDQNDQHSMAVYDYKNRLVASSLVGTGPSVLTTAINPNDNVPDSSYFVQELMMGATQVVDNGTRNLQKSFYMDVEGNDTARYVFRLKPFQVCGSHYLVAKASYKYTITDGCGVTVHTDLDTVGTNGVTTSSTVSVNQTVKPMHLEQGKHLLDKQLYIAASDVLAAVDTLFKDPDQCYFAEQYFIKQEVKNRPIPCNILMGTLDPCELKKREMMDDLYPVTGKYGKYFLTVDAAFPFNDSNSIFTLYGTSEGQTAHYRYQKTCITLPDSVVKNGQTYKNLKTINAKEFEEAFNDQIAEALLPLHPEYCRLLGCFVDSFKQRLASIPNAGIATDQQLFTLLDIITADPLYQKLQQPPVSFTAAKAQTSLAFLGDVVSSNTHIGRLALANAYCGCTDTVMLRKCIEKNLYRIDNLLFTNDAVKDLYYKNLVALYLGNRQRFLAGLTSGAGDTCESCKTARMKLIPAPVFPLVMNPNGTPFNPNDTNSYWYKFLHDTTLSVSTTFITIMLNHPDSVSFFTDAANTTNAAYNSSLCAAQADSIVARLSACLPGHTLPVKVHDTLDAICARGEVAYGNFSPQQVLYALTVNGVSLSDLCNPYIVPQASMQPPAHTATLKCKPASFYASVKSFLNRPAVIDRLAHAGGADTLVVLSPLTNEFENDIKNKVGGNDSVYARAFYDGGDNLYTLLVHRNSDTATIYLRGGGGPTTALCDSLFSNATTSDTFNFTSVTCVLDDPNYKTGPGYVDNYAFVTGVERHASSGITGCTMLGWTDSLQTSSGLPVNIANCIPCTSMRDLYEDFKDTMQAYGIKGTDHPYYAVMLTNFMNHRLSRIFSQEQYLKFIQSCNFADSMLMPRYGDQYITMSFSDTTSANSFLGNLNTVDPAVYLPQPFTEQNDTGRVFVYLDFRMLPPRKMHIYRDYLVTNYPSNIYLNNAPLSTAQLATQCGTVYLAGNFSYSLFDSQYVAWPNAYMHIDSGRTVKIKIGTVWAPFKKFYISRDPSSVSPSLISRNMYLLSAYLLSHNWPAAVVSNYQSTAGKENFSTRKQAFLNYVYSAQHSSYYNVLDSLSEDSLEHNLYPGDDPTYTCFSTPGIFTNLYMASNPVTPKLTLADNMLKRIKDSLGGTIFLPPGQDLLHSWPIGSTEEMYAAHCSDGSYLYIHFDGNDILSYIFLKFPDYIPYDKHHGYQYVSVAQSPGDTASRNLKVTLYKPATSTYITIDGMASFAVGSNIKLNNVLLDNPITDRMPAPDTFNNCEKNLIFDAIYTGKWKYKRYIDSLRDLVFHQFYAYMWDNLQEEFYLGYHSKRFNYTINYYDRAGNLARTVPADGIHKLTGATLKDVDTIRKTDITNSGYRPVHEKVSTYMYNAQNQLVQENTPDGGRTLYYYDAAGRLVFWQNARQYPVGYYNYNLYDRQNRITETGESLLGCAGADPIDTGSAFPGVVPGNCYTVDSAAGKIYFVPAMIQKVADYPHDSIIAYVHSKNRRDVVMTFYDNTLNTYGDTLAGASRNLRNRIACVKYFRTLALTDVLLANYDHAAFYAYDVAGNVKTLVHHFPILKPYGQHYKRVDYDYDIVSGKVNMLSYNRGKPDQFYQRYSYDADNRITKTETSSDGYIWKLDGEYQYYQYGPLARLSLGDLRVQGADYIYTIEGWLKAINGDVLLPAKDIGKDGVDENSIYANDAFAMSLQYYQGDYTAITGSTLLQLPERDKSLYNGNISRQTTSISPFPALNSNYLYDQLNRIKSTAYDAIDPVNATLTPVNDYANTYKYDQDGNLLRLTRRGNTPGGSALGSSQVMDTMNYFYVNNGGPTNRLRNITDHANDVYSIDIKKETSSAGNRYLYDATGNVTKDRVALQDTIKWNTYNKVTRTENQAGKTNIDFLYDGMGNRFAKLASQEHDTSYTEEKDFYVRDAQGNILAVYHTQLDYYYARNEVTKQVFENIRELNGDHTFTDFAVEAFGSGGTFTLGVLEHTSGNDGWLGPLVEAQPVSLFLQNSSVRANMLLNASAYIVPMFTGADTTIARAWKNMFASPGDNDIYDWTNALFSVSGMRGHLMEKMCETDAVLTDYMATQYSIEPQDCNAEASAVASAIGSMSTLATHMAGLYAAQPAKFNLYLDALAADADIYNDESYTGAEGTLITQVQNSLYGHGSVAGISAFFDDWMPDAREQLVATNSQAQLAPVLYNHAPATYIETWGDAYGYDFIDTIVASMPDFSLQKILASADQFGLLLNGEELNTIRKNRYENFYLAEHDIYGSSRLGIKTYADRQYYRSADYALSQTEPAVDEGTLNQPRPWYSYDYADLIRPDSTLPWKSTFQGIDIAAHIRGQKGYELTNHLGNVQAVVSDKRIPRDLDADHIRDRYGSSLPAAYDYYPYGMLMPGRYSQDTSQHCTTISFTEQVFHVNDGSAQKMPAMALSGGGANVTPTGSPAPTMSLTTIEGEDYLDMTTTAAATGAEYYIDGLLPDNTYEMSFNVAGLENEFTLSIVQTEDSVETLLGNVLINTTGQYTLQVTPTVPQVVAKIIGNGSGSIFANGDDLNLHHKTPKTYTYTLCSRPRDNYRYGHNGQEKDNEIAGIGNFNYAHYWEQDVRTGRRWNKDPKPTRGLSPYATFNDNPIFNFDRLGDTTYKFSRDGIYRGWADLDEKGIVGFYGDYHFNSGNAVGFWENGTYFFFNDPELDRKQLEKLQVGQKVLRLVTEDNINWIMQQSNIHPKNVFARLWTAMTESGSGRDLRDGTKMDFGIRYLGGSPLDHGVGFFLFGHHGTAYNAMDGGNWLWGHAMRRLGFSYSSARFGSQANENFNDPPADQRAILSGYNYKHEDGNNRRDNDNKWWNSTTTKKFSKDE